MTTHCEPLAAEGTRNAQSVHVRSQAQAKLQDQKRLSRTLPALEAECAQLNVVAEALAEERQTAGRQLDEVQVAQQQVVPVVCMLACRGAQMQGRRSSCKVVIVLAADP